MINNEGRVELTPIKTSLKDLKGILPSRQKKVTLEDMEKAILEEGGKI